MEDSLDLYMEPCGELSLERALLHAAIIEELLEGAVPAAGQPAILFLAGGPASGKSTLIDQLGLASAGVKIDIDEIRLRLPEYAEWRDAGRDDAAALTQREAADIAKRAWAAALALGCDVVVDAVGGDDDGQFSSKVRAAVERGANVRVIYATVAVELAVIRSKERRQRTGRAISETLLRSKHAEVSRGLQTVAQVAVDDISVYDTSGSEARLLAHGPGGSGQEGLEVVDPEGYAGFLRKGHA